MGFLSFLGRKSRKFDDVIADLDRRQGGLSGAYVSPDTALEVTAVLACVDAIATAVAMPDLRVMRWLAEDKKEPATDDPAYRVFFRRPNEFQTAMEFRQEMTVHAALRGVSVAIPTYHRGKLQELIPLAPGSFEFEATSRYAVKVRVVDEFGPVGEFDRKNLFVIRSLAWDRTRSVPAVAKARQAIGLARTAEASIADLYRNGGRPSGLISTEQKISPELGDRLKAQWEKFKNGSDKYGTAVLDMGMKYTPMGMTAVDQQSNETRGFQIEEICRAFGVFPQIVMHSDKTATFASAEAFFSAHNRLTAGKWQKLWCEQGDEFVLDGAGPLFLEFDNRALNAASLKDTGDFYYKALGGGNAPAHMTPNEVRKDRGQPPHPDGDRLFFPTQQSDQGELDDGQPDDQEK